MADLVITAANVAYIAGAVQTGIAGEALTAGNAIYKKASDGKYWKAQCDTTDEEATVAGVALHSTGANQHVVFQVDGSLNIGATTAKTTMYVLSATAGGIAPQADLIATNRIVFIGYATNTTGTLVLNRKVTGAVV